MPSGDRHLIFLAGPASCRRCRGSGWSCSRAGRSCWDPRARREAGGGAGSRAAPARRSRVVRRTDLAAHSLRARRRPGLMWPCKRLPGVEDDEHR